MNSCFRHEKKPLLFSTNPIHDVGPPAKSNTNPSEYSSTIMVEPESQTSNSACRTGWHPRAKTRYEYYCGSTIYRLYYCAKKKDLKTIYEELRSTSKAQLSVMQQRQCSSITYCCKYLVPTVTQKYKARTATSTDSTAHSYSYGHRNHRAVGQVVPFQAWYDPPRHARDIFNHFIVPLIIQLRNRLYPAGKCHMILLILKYHTTMMLRYYYCCTQHKCRYICGHDE